MQGARPIYIYRLAPCTENCSQRISKTFSLKYLEEVHFFSTFEPKKCRSVFQAAMSACILQILCCGYNRATQKRRKFIKDYDTRICKENSFSSLSAESTLKRLQKTLHEISKYRSFFNKLRYFCFILTRFFSEYVRRLPFLLERTFTPLPALKSDSNTSKSN